MIIVDPGHMYHLIHRPADKVSPSTKGLEICFVKRMCETANHTTEWDGIITQDLIRVCIDRTNYLMQQQPCIESQRALSSLVGALYWFEHRAWARNILQVQGELVSHNGIIPPFTLETILQWPTNIEGHIEQQGAMILSSDDEENKDR